MEINHFLYQGNERLVILQENKINDLSARHPWKSLIRHLNKNELKSKDLRSKRREPFVTFAKENDASSAGKTKPIDAIIAAKRPNLRASNSEDPIDPAMDALQP